MKSWACLVLVVLSSTRAFGSAPADSFNFRFGPLAPVFGVADMNLDYRLSHSWTLGPSFSYLNLRLLDINLRGMSFGLETNYFISGAFQNSAYIDAGFATTTVQASAKSSTGEVASASASGMNYFVGGGYHWFWGSFNLNLGFDVGTTSIGTLEIRDSTGAALQTTQPNFSTGVDFRIGFTF